MNKKQFFARVGAVILALALWQALSMAVSMEILLASPVSVAKRLIELIREPGFLSTVLFSALRVFSGFGTAFVLAWVCALPASRFPVVETLLRPYVVTMKTVPVASFIILCLIWFSYTRLTVFIAFLIAFPVLYTNILTGLRNADPALLEMAKLYKIPYAQRLLYIHLPAVKPYLISASGVAAGMAWKAGIAAEVIGRVEGSIGERLYDAKVYLENTDLLAWTVLIIVVSTAAEKLFVFLLKRVFSGVEKL